MGSSVFNFYLFACTCALLQGVIEKFEPDLENVLRGPQSFVSEKTTCLLSMSEICTLCMHRC